MIRRLIFTSGLVLASAVAFSPKAFAQTVDVNFTANVGPECSFATPIPGTLVMNSPSNGPVPGPPIPGNLSSLAPGGVSGQVDVSCNTNADLQITDVRFVSFTPVNPPNPFDPPFQPPQGFMDAKATTSIDQALGVGDMLPLEVGNQTVEVDMWTDDPIFEAGIYEYAVTLTIVP
ncbi:MAG: hypothetical protein F6K21_35540 [Symploca sp. SIO2D2]|nr:hypothetical protein [Symploca sp. SIO2D2]